MHAHVLSLSWHHADGSVMFEDGQLDLVDILEAMLTQGSCKIVVIETLALQ